MYVRADLAGGVANNAILVPENAVTRHPRGRTNVMVLGSDNVVELRPIEVSSIVGDQWLVESGLDVGERVIVQGLQKVQPGVEVPAGNIDVIINTVRGPSGCSSCTHAAVQRLQNANIGSLSS